MITVVWTYNEFLQTQPSTSSTLKTKDSNSETSKDGLAYACLLKNELLSAGIEDLKVRWAKYLGYDFLLAFM